MNPIDTLNRLLRDDKNLCVTLGTSILPGQRIRVSLYAKKGNVSAKMGYGDDVGAALDDLLTKLEPAPALVLPGLE